MKGIVHYQLIEDGAKAENFHEFLTGLKLPTDKQHYLLLDNARIHHAKQACQELGLSTIKELLIQKNIQPKYLPAYTPELNPVELCFNFIRKYVEKCQPRTFEELEKSVNEATNTLNQKDLTDFF
jgi:DNA phosphorothioation-dependent restriction protein DptG